MRFRRTAIVGVCAALVVATMAGVWWARPDILATEHTYFDLNNGRIKKKWTSFGRAYRECVEETAYSRILKKYGFPEEPPEWRLAHSDDVGVLRRLTGTLHSDWHAGKLRVNAWSFAMELEADERDPATARALTERFRLLVKSGDRDRVNEFVNTLKRKSVSVANP